MDMEGLGSLTLTQSSTSATLRSGPDQKRRKLRHYDLLPAQLINSMGASGIETIDLARLWKSMSSGNKVAEAFSELCFPEPERRGVGLSRLAEVMIATIERLTGQEHYRLCLKTELWEAVERECTQLLPAFKALYAGRGVADGDSASIRAVAYHRPASDPGDLTVHVEKVYEWLSQNSSPLRSVIALLSAGGLFYVAQCHEKGARAWLSSGGGLSAMKTAAAARRPTSRASASSDLGGLSASTQVEA